MHVTGSKADETADFNPGTLKVTRGSYSIHLSNAENITFAGGGGNDTVHLYDSNKNDVFVADPTSATMYGAGFQNTAMGCYRVFAYANKGNDRAELYGGGGDDVFTSYPKFNTLVGTGYFIKTHAFEQTDAIGGQGGNDLAYLYDSAGNDVFYATPAGAMLSGSGYSNYVAGFGRVYVYGSKGTDKATLHGHGDGDVMKQDAAATVLQGEDYWYRVKKFSKVFVSAGEGTKTTRVQQITNEFEFERNGRSTSYSLDESIRQGAATVAYESHGRNDSWISSDRVAPIQFSSPLHYPITSNDLFLSSGNEVQISTSQSAAKWAAFAKTRAIGSVETSSFALSGWEAEDTFDRVFHFEESDVIVAEEDALIAVEEMEDW